MTDELEELRLKLAGLQSEEARAFAIVDFLEMARLTGSLEELAGGAAEFINMLPPSMRRALVANAQQVQELRGIEPEPIITTAAWANVFDTYNKENTHEHTYSN